MLVDMWAYTWRVFLWEESERGVCGSVTVGFSGGCGCVSAEGFWGRVWLCV